MAGTWLGLRSKRFFVGQNFWILSRKSIFCYRTPDFVNGPFVALAKAVDLAPSDWLLNFLFPSYSCFREGDPPTRQKVLPHLTMGALTDSNSPWGPRAKRAGWISPAHKIENGDNFIQTVWKLSNLSGNFPDCREIFQTVRKLSRLCGNFLDCLENFQADFRLNSPDRA